MSWDRPLAVVLSEADRAVGRLAGEGRRLPNPRLLIRPFVRKEAVLSSRIEGTQATLRELLAAEAGAAVSPSPEDLREVGNYVIALEYGLERLDTLPMSLRLARDCTNVSCEAFGEPWPHPVSSGAARTGSDQLDVP